MAPNRWLAGVLLHENHNARLCGVGCDFLAAAGTDILCEQRRNHRILLTTQSSSVPIVHFDAMSKLLFALWSPILNSTSASGSCASKIDLEPGDRSTTSVFVSSAKENLTDARWRSGGRAIASMSRTVPPEAAIHGRICGSIQRRRSSLT